MANLGTFDITGNDYVNLETATGLTLTTSNKYVIQSYDNDFYIRVGTSGDGIYTKSLITVDYTHGSSDLYIKPVSAPIRLNIHEQES